MSIVSAVPGQTVNTTLTLPAAAVGPVSWTVRDPTGALVARGQAAPSGVVVLVSFVLPQAAVVPLDGSRYALDATDGKSSAIEYFQVLSPDDLSLAVSTEVAYVAGQNFMDVLALPQPATSVMAIVYRADGSVALPSTVVDISAPSRYGDSYIYRIVTASPLNMNTNTSFGTGTIVWTYSFADSLMPDQEMHNVYTVTPYSTTFLGTIRKLVDRARIGDANRYLAITTSDLAHALMRGADYVMQSEPVMTPFTLDGLPIFLRDYIVKAGAVDLLRAQFLCEGMSAFDMQGQGVQLQVDRTQYISSLIEELNTDLQLCVQAKKKWLEQGAPMGAQPVVGRRPIAHLGLSTGVFSNFPQIPLPLPVVPSNLYTFMRYGPLR